MIADEAAILQVIRESMQVNFGDYGLGSALQSLQGSQLRHADAVMDAVWCCSARTGSCLHNTASSCHVADACKQLLACIPCCIDTCHWRSALTLDTGAHTDVCHCHWRSELHIDTAAAPAAAVKHYCPVTGLCMVRAAREQHQQVSWREARCLHATYCLLM